MAPIGKKLAALGTRFTALTGMRWGGRAPTPPPMPFKEMGTSGTAVYGGYVQIKERSPEWTGRQKWVTASELAVNTSIVAAGTHYFLNLVAYPKWTFQPHDEEDEESLALAEFVEHVLNDMDTPWYKIVRRAAMYRFHGFGLQEWTAKHRKDGLIGFKDIESRPQHTIEQWDVDFDGTVLGAWQRSPQTGNLLGLPRDKLLYLVEDTLTDSPEGIGMFRHMADPYARLKQLQTLEMRAYERDLRGTPIARAPITFINKAIKAGAITQADGEALIQKFERLVALQVKQSDTGILLDSMPYFSDSDAGDQVSAVPQWGFELLTGAGVGHAEIAAAIDRVQREIARIIGVEHLMMGDTGGNRALSEDKSRNLYLIANSVLKYIGSAVKADILVPLWKLNGFPMDKMPEPKPEDVTFKNAEAITNAIGKMASAGAVLSPNDPVINDIRDLLGVSRQPEDIAAQGMQQNPNAILAGLPPELQAQALGGPGIAGPGMGGGPGGPGGLKGPPGKVPGQGGGQQPGKAGKPKNVGKAKPVTEDEEHKPEDADAPVSEDTTELDLNGPKPGGKIEVNTDLLVRVLERLTGESAGVEQQAQQQGNKPDGKAPVDQGVEAAGDKPDAEQGLPTSRGEGRVSQSAASPKGEAQGKPGSKAPAAEPDDEAATQGAKPTAKPQAGKPQAALGEEGDSAVAGKPAAGAMGGDQPAKPGQPPKPGEPMDPAQAAAAGLPPGTPAGAAPEPEMTPERASEILQPYADHSHLPEEDNPQTESDALWTRLGEEKDVQAAVSDQDPMEILDRIEDVLGGGDGKPKLGDEDIEGAEQPEDGDVTDGLAPGSKPGLAAKPTRQRERIVAEEGEEEEEDVRKPPRKRRRERL